MYAYAYACAVPAYLVLGPMYVHMHSNLPHSYSQLLCPTTINLYDIYTIGMRMSHRAHGTHKIYKYTCILYLPVLARTTAVFLVVSLHCVVQHITTGDQRHEMHRRS